MTMCYYPWVGLDISAQGEYKPCCKFDIRVANNLDDYLNSDTLADLKSAFLRGERPKACNRCWNDEDAGITSKREFDWENVFHYQTPDLTKYKTISLPFGNTCNLTCRTCKSYASSKWLSEEKKLKKHYPEINLFPHNQYYKDNNFIDKIKSLSDEIVLLEIPGGEPFITGIEQQLDFLDYLIDHNAKNMEIRYMTNATTLPDNRFWDKWRHFKTVDIQLSIDGTEKVYEYVRYPGNWNEVYPNIKFYQNKQKEHKNLKLSISNTVSIFNIFYLDQFIDWCNKESLPKPYLGLVSRPDHFSITCLSNKTKEYLNQYLVNELTIPVKSYMNSKDDSYLLDKTCDYVILVDQYRNQKFNESLVEYSNVLKQTCNKMGNL